ARAVNTPTLQNSSRILSDRALKFPGPGEMLACGRTPTLGGAGGVSADITQQLSWGRRQRPASHPRGRTDRMRTYAFAAVAALTLLVLFAPSSASTDTGIEFRSLDGGGNNAGHFNWGRAGTPYTRALLAPATYPDGVGAMQDGPPARYVSNRIFNDFDFARKLGQNLFSENDVSQIGWLWGQFIDHTIDLRDETQGDA